ncbi:CPBP family intramembrane glutamic endopeptidase [Symbiobacterium thermophilum]|uniref:CPBP family intramembrane glutamic endopeptidase n=1 Tax=Symbiobacterium thermophilum TaxID=2734 RepID=UPI0035C749C0
MTTSLNPVSPAPRPSVWRQLRAGVTHPAGVLFLALWVAGAATLALRGRAELVLEVVFRLLIINLIPLVVLLRRTPYPPAPDAPRHRRWVLWVQVAFLAALIALGVLYVLGHYGLIPSRWTQVPVWTQANEALEHLGEKLFGQRRIVANPALNALLPGVVLWLGGVRPAELWLRRGHSSFAVAAPYLIFVAIAVVPPVIAGDTRTAAMVGLMLVRNFFVNGFTEEFLFRGALQTRLSQLLGEGWGLVLASLIFGVAHVGGLMPALDGDVLAALGLCITSQAAAGLIFGILAMRTRSLIAPTVAHLTLNLFG